MLRDEGMLVLQRVYFDVETVNERTLTRPLAMVASHGPDAGTLTDIAAGLGDSAARAQSRAAHLAPEHVDEHGRGEKERDARRPKESQKDRDKKSVDKNKKSRKKKSKRKGKKDRKRSKGH